MPRSNTQPTGRQAYVPVDSFVTEIDGVPVSFQIERDRVSEEWLAAHPNIRHLFKPAGFHYDIEQATAAPGETRG